MEKSFTAYCAATNYESTPRPRGLSSEAYVEQILVPAVLEYRALNGVVPKDFERLVPHQLPCIHWPLGIRHRWRYAVVAENGVAKSLHVGFSRRGWSRRYDSDGPSPRVFHVKLGAPGEEPTETFWAGE